MLKYKTYLFIICLAMLAIISKRTALNPVLFYSALALYVVLIAYLFYKIGKLKKNKKLR
ncbi:hypothetical protein [Staphylococcus simulans]|uniref:hypothetical protein n=1 Tax=Staphylococcus simulans TaxID=1286 RepID=UPI003F7D8C86